MNNAQSENARRWWQPGIVQYAGWEMLAMRALFAFFIFQSMEWNTSEFQSQPYPNGIAHFVDLSGFGHNPPGDAAQWITMAGLILFALGIVPILGMAPALFYMICIGTLANSQGAMNHSSQMVTMMLLAQFLCYACGTVREIRNPKRFLLPHVEIHRLATHAAVVVIAASYVVSGLVKWIKSDGMWIWKTPSLSLQLVKANFNDYYNTLIPPPAWLEQATTFLVDHPWFTRMFFGTGLLIETAAFVILINRRWAFFGGLAIIALHFGISQLMNLEFESHVVAALIFLVNLPGTVAVLVARLRKT